MLGLGRDEVEGGDMVMVMGTGIDMDMPTEPGWGLHVGALFMLCR